MAGASRLGSGPSQGIVRTFSDKLQNEDPADSLHRGLAAKVAHDRNAEARQSARAEWNALLQDTRDNIDSLVPEEEVVLLAQSRKLYAAWEKFQKALPKDQRKDLAGKPPDLKLLFETVQTASSSWQQQSSSSKRGKAKAKFASLCQHIEDHRNIVKMLPTEDKYFTLLLGSLTTVVQATVNHKEIADGVERTLDELAQNIAFWNRQIEVHGNAKHIYKYIVELYVIVFEFLTQIFDEWSKSSLKRFMTSFNENAFQKLFTEKRARMATIEMYMEREARLEYDKRTMEKFNKMLAAQEELIQSNRLVLRNQDVSAQSQQELRFFLGANVQKLLEERHYPPPSMFLRMEPENSVQEDPSPIPVDGSKQSPAIISDSESEPEELLVDDEIMDNLAPLEADFKKHLERILALIDKVNRLEVDFWVQQRLAEWTQKLSKDSLWIQGPHGGPQPSQNTTTALFLTALARQNDLKCITYFCNLADQDSHTTSPSTQLTEILTSIITQLILLIPPSRLTTLTILRNQHQLQHLRARTLSFDDTLSLLRPLRAAGPPLLMVVIDNLQALEDRSDKDYTTKLLRTVGTLCTLDPEETKAGPGEPRAVSTETKICFTTDGYMDALAQAASLNLADKVEFSAEADEGGAEETVTMVL